MIARVLGQLLFMLLMCLMHTAEGSVLYTLIYLAVYRLTARVYFGIVRRG